LAEYRLLVRLLRSESVSVLLLALVGSRKCANHVCLSSIVIFTLSKGGPKPAIIVTSSLLLVGNWIRFAGAKANKGIFGVTMFGQILIGLAQPFCLSAPTRYSDLWFSDRGRTSATAVATLANPLGAALGQLINSFWASEPHEVPDMVLYISIMVSISRIFHI
jgi:sugar phosphate permease